MTAATTVTIPESKQIDSDEVYELSKKLVVSGKARLIIKGEHKGVAFDDLIVYDNSWVEFGQLESALHLKFNKNAQIGRGSTLDFSRTRYALIKQAENEEVSQSVTTIGNVLFQKIIAFHADNINFVGDVKLKYSEGIATNETAIGIEATNIKFFEKA